MAEPDIVVTEDAARSRYEIFVDGDRAGVAFYRDRDGVRVFTHTRVADGYEGRGIGSKLARGALDDVRAKAMSIVAQCPFIAAYIERHPDYADLVAHRRS